MWQCHYCRSPLSPEIQRKNRLCPRCGSDIHACKNCQHYDERLTTSCRESNSPWIADRSGQNSCPYFEFKTTMGKDGPVNDEAVLSEAEKAKKAFKALFRSP